jgi:hypothetical protein
MEPFVSASAVREGLEAGLQLHEDVGEAYIKALCDTEQPVCSWSTLVVRLAVGLLLSCTSGMPSSICAC